MLQPFINSENIEIGIDEAGRGPLFGRLYTAAVILPKSIQIKEKKKTKEIDWTSIKDSKKIKSHSKMKACAEFIKKSALAYSVQYVDPEIIDEINIRQAVFRGMHACIRDLLSQTSAQIKDNIFLLVDGNDFKPYAIFDETTEKLEYLPYQTIEKGDNTYLAIAAASILAKYTRDEYMLELCNERPELKDRYSMHINMGYGTQKHMDGIRSHGLVDGHRKTFTSHL
jgi:ribonuclease HII